MKKPQISVVVPVYKVEKYLSRCVDSILQQTFTDFELLLIDDGSPDSSGKLCDEYKVKDDRIRVFHQENKGVSAARNLGLDNASGKYICFVDSDDYVDSEYLKKLFDALLPENEYIGLIIQGFKIHTPNNFQIGELCLSDKLLFARDIRIAYIEDNICRLGYSCCKLYNNETLNTYNIRFNEQIRCCEDLLFMLTYLLHCDYLCFTNALEYNYVKYPVSLSYIVNSFDSEYTAFVTYLSLIKQSCKQYGIDPDTISSTWASLMVLFRRALKTCYLPGRKINSKQRLTNIRKIVMGNEDLIKKHYNPTYKLDKLGKWMLLSHNFNLFDRYTKCLFLGGIKSMFLGGYNDGGRYVCIN